MDETRNAATYSLNGEDRISRLRDSLIHHILSSIDAKFAVQTSVLSKRWISIWKSLPFLNFNRISFSQDNTKGFIDFVYFVFTFRDDTTNVQKFSVDWADSEFGDTVIMNVNRWWLSAVKRDVQEISITISQYHDSAYEIPHLLLNCKSLRKLSLIVSNTAEYLDFILPRSMSLPQLKELFLHGLSSSDVDFYKRLLSSCPVLEKLWICHCRIQTDNPWNLIIDSVSLKKFAYVCWKYDTMANIIRLNTPHLVKFACLSFLTQDYSLEICCPLSGERFCIFLKYSSDDNAFTYMKLPLVEKVVYAKRAMKFLRAVYMVKKLRLTPGFLEVLSQAPDLLERQPPRLCNLLDLKLEMWLTRGCLRDLAYLLKISPNINQLFLISDKSKELAEVGDDWEAGLSSPGMLSHLKYVQIQEVNGCDAELKILSFLLKYATVLVEVALSFRSSVGC